MLSSSSVRFAISSSDYLPKPVSLRMRMPSVKLSTLALGGASKGVSAWSGIAAENLSSSPDSVVVHESLLLADMNRCS